jgi:hypothetical protein
MSAADASHDGRIDMREWVEYATRRVPQVQIQEMELASARGANLAFADDELVLRVASRSGQRPRMFYRPDASALPIVMSNADLAADGWPGQRPGDFNGGVAPATQQREMRPLAIAVSDRTIMDEPLPPATKTAWQEKLTALNHSAKFETVDDPGQADWILQVASLKRPEIFFLVPATDADAEVKAMLTLMSPPGDASLPWLATELSRLSALGPVDPSHFAATQERAFLGVFRKGPAEDLKADIVEEQSGVYHTANRTQAVLGTYGKLVDGNRLMGRLPKFEHRGLVGQLEQVRRFATVQRQGHSAGKDFLSLAGARQAWQFVNLGGRVAGSRENEVSYEILGVRLDQNDVIKALNADSDALTYFDYLASQQQSPCVVLENVVFTNYASSQGTTLELAGTAENSLTPDRASADFQNQRTASTEFRSPVIRCYQMYAVKMHQGKVMELTALDP